VLRCSTGGAAAPVSSCWLYTLAAWWLPAGPGLASRKVPVRMPKTDSCSSVAVAALPQELPSAAENAKRKLEVARKHRYKRQRPSHSTKAKIRFHLL
jgi:hypothetical protein